MPRQARKKSSSGIYHIMLRGINRQQIFEDDEDRERFLETIENYKDLCGYTIYAYCLMGNHVHILMHEGKEDLTQVFKRIAGSYVYWYNWKYHRSGHLFQDRFKSEPVEDDAYFLTVLRYIHQNPVKAKICKYAEEYPYSSMYEYLKHPVLADTSFALSMLPGTQFLEYHKEANDDKCDKEFVRGSNMKRIGTILLLVIFTLSLTACSTTEIWVDDGMYITYRDIHFSALEEYEEQLRKEGELPVFITYDMLEEIGEFKSFVCHSAASFAESQSYLYSLIDDCDYELMLSIYNRPKKEVIIKELPQIRSVANESDLRMSGKQESCRFELGAITYRYAKDGRLSTIRWVTQTHIFLLSVSDSSKDFMDYDLEADTFVAKLLNADTATKTVKEFNRSIRESLPRFRVWNKFCRYWLPWILVAVVSCATIGTVYLILRRKAKKKRDLYSD